MPERVRVIAAPGELRGVELEVRGWRTEQGETALICRLLDGSSGTIPARWTDLTRHVPPDRALGAVASPAAWRLLLSRGEDLSAHERPWTGSASYRTTTPTT